MPTLLHARRLLAIELLHAFHPVEEVMLAAGVAWKVLSAWCAAEENPPWQAWHYVELYAEEVRARRLSEQRKREYHKDLTYCHKLEHLNDLKEEYRLLEKRRCVPFTNESSHEIDELQALLDGWFTVAPEVWTEEEFVAAHEHHKPTLLSESRSQEQFFDLEEVELDFDPEDLF